MSDIQQETAIIEGVILKNPRTRSWVSAGAALIGVGLGMTHAWFNGHDPAWLTQALIVYSTVIAPVGFGIWKANVK